MVREDKVKVVKDLEDLFKSANALVLAEYRGLTVTQQTKLRRELKKCWCLIQCSQNVFS